MRILLALSGIVGVAVLILLGSTAYIVDEGNVAVITNWGKAVRQEGPDGLKLRNPISTGVKEFDTRERSITGTIAAATSNQLATTMDYSVNWQPVSSEILNIYVRYGPPNEFASNTIRPRLAQSLKATIGKFSGEEMIRKREEVAAAMLLEVRRVLETYPVLINSVQVENFTLPTRYMEAVIAKEEQRQLTQKEQLILEQQDITAQQNVQTANAERDAIKARADGEAYQIRVVAEARADATILAGEAEARNKLASYEARAEGLRAQMSALGDAAMVVEFNRNIAWNGTVPTTVLGTSPDLLMQMDPAQ